ncbi:MAG: AzlD domain-containing protein [Spirochaetota bacterium]
MKLWLIIILISILTYLPRYLPYRIMMERKLPPAVERFLYFVPCATLGALIFPGAIHAVEGLPFVSLAGIAASFAAAWISRNLVVSVFSAVGVCYGLIYLGGY